MKKSKNLSERIIGSFYGSALGDGFGYKTEFLQVDEIKMKWGPNGLTEPIGDPIQVSDDTQMAIAVSNAVMNSWDNGLLEKPQFEEQLIKEFIVWLNSAENNRAPGMTCLTSCEKLEKGLSWLDATGKNSKGCGANMRVSPIAWLKFKDENISLQDIAKWAQLQSAITHAHPTALAASDLTAVCIVKLIEGTEPSMLVQVMIDYCESQKEIYHEYLLENIWERPGYFNSKDFIKRGWTECISVLNKVADGLVTKDIEKDPCLITGEGWCAEEAFATALLCFLLFPDDPVKTLIHAVNTKGDSDSIACIAGALTGAHNGIKSFPEDWIQRIEYQNEIKKYIDFLELD